MSCHNRILPIVQDATRPFHRQPRRYQVMETPNAPDLSPLPEAFRILESTADGSRVIALSGELDLSNAAQLEERTPGISTRRSTDPASVHRQQRHPRADQHRPESAIRGMDIQRPERATCRLARDQSRRARSATGPRESNRAAGAPLRRLFSAGLWSGFAVERADLDSVVASQWMDCGELDRVLLIDAADDLDAGDETPWC